MLPFFFKNKKSQLFLTTLFLGLSAFQVQAQIDGKVLDPQSRPIPFANVLLVKASDSLLVKGCVTDENGNFQIGQQAPGEFRLRISCIGYQTQLSAVFHFTPSTNFYHAGSITLLSSAQALNKVEVTAEKQFIERHIDRLVVNIDKSIVSSGTSGLDIFKRLPGVSVDQAENISLKNKPGVLILINGRATNLSAQDLANLLKSMTADQIERIEIMENPPAKYDAAGSAGVINIVMKKNQALGLNGTVRLGGLLAKEPVFPLLSHTGEIGISLNYRTPKWNFFGSYDYSTEFNYWGQDFTNRFLANNQLQSTLTQSLLQSGTSDNQYAKIGIDYQISPRQSIGILANARYIHGVASNSLNHIELRDSLGNLKSGVNSYFNVYEPIQTADMNLNYDFKIDSSGKDFTINADYLYYLNPNEHNLYYYAFDNNNQFLPPFQHVVSKQINNIQIQSVKADYTHPLSKKIKLEGVVKTSLVSSDNDGKYWNVINGVYQQDMSMTNHFIYTEQINAAYVNYSQEINSKLSLQLGLRGEQSLVKGQQLVQDTTFQHTYLNAFPSAFFQWKPNETNSLTLSYSKRIDRPDYQAVNPFLYARGPYMYNQGNANLRPEYTNGFNLTHAYKSLITTSLGYSQTNDVVIPVSRQDDMTHITYNSLTNLSSIDNYNAVVSLVLPIRKWWTSNTSLGAYYHQYHGTWDGGVVDNGGAFCTINSQNTFSLGKRWSAEINAVYVSPQPHGISVVQSFCLLDAGAQWKFGGEKGTLRINAGDLLWSHFTEITNYQNMNMTSVFYSTSRMLHVSVIWKLGTSTSSYRSKARAGAEELNRVK
ncbi:MAG TPA: outer membrane beta-barrel protein [Bacteroidia bacterium]|jgi:iron complex outermembrane receptor protein|nr:outer membrane beta-barrel protein [Bacteroidia bacterium]